jgi:hypothetical protein
MAEELKGRVDGGALRARRVRQLRHMVCERDSMARELACFHSDASKRPKRYRMSFG